LGQGQFGVGFAGPDGHSKDPENGKREGAFSVPQTGPVSFEALLHKFTGIPLVLKCIFLSKIYV
ncbi:hypothetical protein K1T55_23320, partial [Salmonella enterica]|uniref:hypothetical protein n=1 Tax=Salmonella enterica TaxID=28901 RepID=UPI001C68FDFC